MSKRISKFCCTLILIVILGACKPAALLVGETPSPTSLTQIQSTSKPDSSSSPQSFTAEPSEKAQKTEGIPLNSDSKIPPLPLANVTAEFTDEVVELKWKGTGSDIIVHYIVYRRIESDGEWEQVAFIQAKGNNKGGYVYHDAMIDQLLYLEYAVTALDIYGNESELSNIVSIEIET